MSKQVIVSGRKVFESNKGTRKTGKGFDGTLERKYGYIDYIVFPKIKTVVFNGSFIHKSYRGRGIYKKLVKELLMRWKGYEFHCLAVNPKVVTTLINRFGFKVTSNPLYYWGTAGADGGGQSWRMKRTKQTRKGTMK